MRLRSSQIKLRLRFPTSGILAITAATLWAAALFFPALRADDRVIQSLYILGFGWVGPILGGYFEWMANPLLLFATLIIVLGIRNKGVLVSLGVVGVALLILGVTETSFPATEAGNYVVQAHYLGWYLWIAAQGIALIALAVSWFERFDGPEGSDA